MGLYDDIAGGYAHIGNIETVTHTEQPAGTATNTVQAHRDELSFREVAMNGPAGIASTDIIWVLWSATLNADPESGDTVTDSEGNVWMILSVAEHALGTTSIKWRCVARKQQ